MMHRERSWALAAGLASCLLLAAFAPALGAGPDRSAYVAEWTGGGLTVEEFISWWKFGSEGERPALATLEERLKFVEPLISAELMIEEAESVGITQLPTVADFYRGRRTSVLTERLQTRATEGRVTIDRKQVDEIIAKRNTEMDIKQIIVRTQTEANALLDSIRAGAAFEDLAQRYSTSPTGEVGGTVGTVRWGDFSDRWSAQAYRLEPGQASEPFQVEGGYCILKSYGKRVTALPDSLEERKKIVARLAQEATLKERKAYQDSLKLAYDYNMDVMAVVDLSAKYAVGYAKMGEPTTVVDADVDPGLTEAEARVPLVTMKGKTLTAGAMARVVARTPFQVRPRVDDPDDFIPFINMQATDSLLVAEAEKLGLDRDEDVVNMVAKAKRRKTLLAFYEYVARDAVVSDEEARAFYDANRQYFTMPEGYNVSKIVVGTREAADSLVARLGAGEAFGDLARARSRDPFSAPQGGDMGFLKKGADQEFDGFLATMQPGETKVFRSLEGYVVLWLMEGIPTRPASFEESRQSIDQRLVQDKKEQLIDAWIATRRAERGVRIDNNVLEAIVLPS
ncbi:MAG: peptidylprolyl isomerase [bacterium]